MLQKTKGIVLHSLKYSENSIIVKIYTESSGLVTYIVRSVRSKKSAMKAGIFQPLTILELVVYHKKKPVLQTLKEITSVQQFTRIPYDIRKSSVAIFIAEVLYKTIREEEQNKELFDFILHSVELLDSTEGRISEFNLFFLIELTKFLGFYPHDNFDEKNVYFNLYDGHFQENLPEHTYYIEQGLSKHFSMLLKSSYNETNMEGISVLIRKELMNKILDYYRIHVNGFQTLKSHIVLEEVFR